VPFARLQTTGWLVGAWDEVLFWADGRVMAAAGRGRPQPGPLTRLRLWLGW
jgi:hypothetical protein